MNIQSLMSAAHAAGFAMAVSDEYMGDDRMEGMVSVKPVKGAEVAATGATGTALALAMPVHSRTQWIREWLVGWRAGAPA